MLIKKFSLKKNFILFSFFSLIISYYSFFYSYSISFLAIFLVLITSLIFSKRENKIKKEKSEIIYTKGEKQNKKYSKLSHYSQLLSYMEPLYEWEKKNYPFLSQFPAFRFVRKEKAQRLEDYQSIYVNSKENLIYTFNLINQSYSLSLEAFMIDDIKEFYISLELEDQKEKAKKVFFKTFFLKKKEKNKFQINQLLEKINKNEYIYIRDIKLVFSFYNEEIKPLKIYLYPPSPEKIPYQIMKEEDNYNLIIDKAFSIISLLELLQGGFFAEQEKDISLDGLIRINP